MKTEGIVTVDKVVLTPKARELLEEFQGYDLDKVIEELEDISNILLDIASDFEVEINHPELMVYLRDLSLFRKLGRAMMIKTDK